MNAKKVENLIIGAGPAGLQMAHDFKKSGIDYLILEREKTVGAFFKTYPRHRTLISINKVYSECEDEDTRLRFDWNSLLCDNNELLFRNYDKKYFPDADNLVRYMEDFADHFKLSIEHGSNVESITRNTNDGFVVKCNNGHVFSCDRLIVATGRFMVNVPTFTGVEYCVPYDTFSIDPNSYLNQRVMIIGKGNSGFEMADSINDTSAAIHMASPNPIKLAWKTHYVGHLRAVNNSLLDTYQLKSGNTILDAEVVDVTKNEDNSLSVRIRYSHAEGQERVITVDQVLLCTGFKFDCSIFNGDTTPTLTENKKFPEVTPHWESVNQKNMYFAGCLMHGLDEAKTFSGFIHGFRYNVRCMVQDFATRFYGKEWPSDEVFLNTQDFSKKILDRVNICSSLYQQPGFIGDVIGVDSSLTGTHYYDVPMKIVESEGWKGYEEYWTLVLDYGHISQVDPFNINRFPFSKGGDDSTFLHPIICRFKNGKMISKHHISQDLENKWVGERFTVPLAKYLDQEFMPMKATA